MTSTAPPARPALPGLRRPVLGIRARLLILVLAVVVPFLVMATLRARERSAQAREAVGQTMLRAARDVVVHLDDVVAAAERLLHGALVVVRPDAAMTAYNDSVLALMARELPTGITSLHLQDTRGNNIGSSVRPLVRRSALQTAGRPYFREALRAKRFTVGEVVRGSIDTTRWLLPFAKPLFGRDGAVRAVAVTSLQLAQLAPILDAGRLAPGAMVTAVDRNGRVLGRSEDAERWVGRLVQMAPAAGQPTEGVMELADGVRRLSAYATTRRAGWTVFVSTPTPVAFGPTQEATARDFLLIAATFAVALLAAFLVAGRIVRPISALTADASAIASGDLSRRSQVSATSELGVLARQFNVMAETIDTQTRRLREDEERYRELFELSPFPTYLFDEESLRFLAVNDAMLRLYGWTREEFLGMTARDIRPAEEVAWFESQMRQAPPAGVQHRRVHHLTRDGRRLEIEIASTRTTAFGRPAWLTVSNDVTQRERTEEALRESQEQLRQVQKIEAVGSLAAGIAHDFNNLLTGVLGSCDLALLSLPQSHPAHQELVHAREAAVRATDLTRRLLTFSRQQTSAAVHTDLREVVRGMQSLVVRTLGEQVKLELRLDRAPCAVLADPGQLEQVALNLLVNARDAMPTGGTVTIDVRPLKDAERPEGLAPGRWVLLSVSDTGTGMDATTAKRVFEPFFTTKERGKGTGLGLSMVFSIVQNAGGQVRLQTAPRRGSTFRVYLPLHDEVPARRPSPERGAPTAGGRETILLVEDDEAVRRVTMRMLETLAYSVLSAKGPREALQLARDHIGPIDLLLTDVIMPGMNGREMADAMRLLRPRIQIVYASGYTEDVALTQQLRTSALFFLQKPFTNESLGRTIRQALDTPPEGMSAEAPR